MSLEPAERDAPPAGPTHTWRWRDWRRKRRRRRMEDADQPSAVEEDPSQASEVAQPPPRSDPLYELHFEKKRTTRIRLWEDSWQMDHRVFAYTPAGAAAGLPHFDRLRKSEAGLRGKVPSEVEWAWCLVGTLCLTTPEDRARDLQAIASAETRRKVVGIVLTVALYGVVYWISSALANAAVGFGSLVIMTMQGVDLVGPTMRHWGDHQRRAFLRRRLENAGIAIAGSPPAQEPEQD